MMVIDSHGRALDKRGNVIEDDRAFKARMRREAFARRLDGFTDEGAARLGERLGRALGSTVRKIAFFVLALAVLGFVVNSCDPKTVEPTTTVVPAGSVPGQPVNVASTYTAPVGEWTPRIGDRIPERTAPFSGSTEADARDGWTNVVVAENGEVKLNGVLVDNVRDPESPLRARYLASLERQSQRVGSDGANVGEGLRFCGALDVGLPTAERELMDANADHNSYGTSARRMAIAVASVSYFCPAHMPS